MHFYLASDWALLNQVFPLFVFTKLKIVGCSSGITAALRMMVSFLDTNSQKLLFNIPIIQRKRRLIYKTGIVDQTKNKSHSLHFSSFLWLCSCRKFWNFRPARYRRCRRRRRARSDGNVVKIIFIVITAK